MARTINFVNSDDAEDSKALIVLLVGMLAIMAVALSLWVGLMFGIELNKSENPEMTKAQIKALNIMPAKGEKR